MLCKAVLFTVALALIVSEASASPLVGQGSGPIRVPLAKRNALTNADGTFNYDKAVIHSVKAQNKHRQNLINLERNKGRESFNEGAKIKPFALIPSHVHKRQNEALTDEQDALWVGNISIGSNDQPFVVDFDTGSSDLWIPNKKGCSDCDGKNTYDSAASSSSQPQSGTFAIQYADGSMVSGPIFTDTVTVAGVQADNQSFSAVTGLGSFTGADLSIDGILGMSYQEISQLQAPPFVQTAYAHGAIPENVFAFKLAQSGPELFLGGTNQNLYSGEIEYHPVRKSAGWQATGAQVLVANKTIASNFDTIIDTGTSIIYGPPSSVKALYKAIPGSQLADEEYGFYSYPCESAPTVGFNWGGQTWTISTDNFNLGQLEDGSSECVGAIAGMDLGLGKDVWLLGDSFIKNVYVAFNFTGNSIGFAALA